MARRLALQVDLKEDAATKARAALNALADDLDPELLGDLRLLVTELVANSVRHSGASVGSVQIDVRTGNPEHVRAEVADPGSGFEAHVSEPDPTRPHGLGLYLLDSLADRWGVFEGGETRVWFEIQRGPASS